jgi:predicted Zn-dependent peptidase
MSAMPVAPVHTRSIVVPPRTAGDTVRLTTLPSGLRVVSEPMGHAATVSLGVWIGAGSRDELPDEHGLAHFLEHMAFKGTKRRSARDIAEEIETVGGDLNAATSMEYTCYTARVLGQDLPLAVDLLADILSAPAFAEDEIAREKGVVLQELGSVDDTPDDLVYDLFIAAAFPDQALGRAILGTRKTVSAFSAESLRGYLARCYTPGQMVVAAAGAVDHDSLVKLVEEAFADFPAGSEMPVRPAGVYGGGEKRKRARHEQVNLVLGFKGQPFQNGEHYPLQVFASVLGGGLSSRLFQEVREKRGLCYAIDAFHWPFSDCGVFGIGGGTAPEDAAELVTVVLDVMRQSTLDLTEAEVSRAKAQMKVGLLAALEAPGGRVEQMARQVLSFGRVVDGTEITAKLDAVTIADVRDAGRALLASRPTLTAIGPIAKLPKLKALTAGLPG